jgi:nucleoside-diphosphate-sugar epimerase
MKVLVTGAAGFVGSHIIGALLKAGHEVRGLTRRMPSPERERIGVEYIDDVDVAQSSTLTPQMFHEIDAIVHLVGIIREGPGDQNFQQVHVEGTRNVIEAADAAGFMGRFLYLSAIGAAPDAPSEYARTKYGAEQVVRFSRLPFTILRPSVILGKDGEFVQQMRDLVLHGGLSLPVPMPFIPVPGGGNSKFQPLAVGDLAACVIRSLENPDTAYQLYELGGASQVTFNEMLAAFSSRLGVAKPLFHAPMGAMNIAAAVMEAIMPKPPITRDQLTNLALDNVTESHAIEDVYKILPLTFEQTLDLIFAAQPDKALQSA